MKKIVMPLLMVFSLTAFAQTRFSIGLLGSTDITSMHRNSPAQKFSRTQFDKSSFGYQAGIRTNVDFTKVFSAQLGFSFVSHTIGTERFALNPLEQGDPYVPDELEYSVTYKSFQIPLCGSFYFGNNLRFGFTLGAAYNYIYKLDDQAYGFSSSGTMLVNSEERVSSNNQYLSTIAGVGVEYKCKKLLVRLEPSGSLQLTSFNIVYGEDMIRLWSAGIALSSFYRF